MSEYGALWWLFGSRVNASGEYVAVVMSQVIKKRRPKAYEKYYHGHRASRRGG